MPKSRPNSVASDDHSTRAWRVAKSNEGLQNTASQSGTVQGDGAWTNPSTTLGDEASQEANGKGRDTLLSVTGSGHLTQVGFRPSPGSNSSAAFSFPDSSSDLLSKVTRPIEAPQPVSPDGETALDSRSEDASCSGLSSPPRRTGFAMDAAGAKQSRLAAGTDALQPSSELTDVPLPQVRHANSKAVGCSEGADRTWRRTDENVRLTNVPLHFPSGQAGKAASNSSSQLPSSNSEHGRRFDGEADKQEKPDRATLHTNKLRDSSEAGASLDSKPQESASTELLGSIEGRAPTVSSRFAPSFETSGHTQDAGRPQSAPTSQDSSSHVSNSSQSLAESIPESGLQDVTVPVGIIGNGRLIERLRESEVSLNVRSVDFGNVSIHTAMNREHLFAQISLERQDLGKALASEVEALQSKLSQEHGIRATIAVQHQSSSFGEDPGQPQNGSSHSQSQPQQYAERPEVLSEQPGTAPALLAATADGRLDIRI